MYPQLEKYGRHSLSEVLIAMNRIASSCSSFISRSGANVPAQPLLPLANAYWHPPKVALKLLLPFSCEG
jgi:hypothetical protein